MKFLLFLLIPIFVISCTVNESQEIESAVKPVTAISPPSQDLENIKVEESNELGTIHIPFPKPDKIDEKDLYKLFIKESLEKFPLQNLEKQKFSNTEFEIRIWHFTDLYMPIYKDAGVRESVFTFKFKNKKWSAYIIRETVKFKDKNEFRKIIRNDFSEPKISWEEFEQQLKSICKITEEDKKSYGNEELLIVESNSIENYQIFTLGNINRKAELFDLLADNFDVEEMKRTKDVSSTK